MEGATKLPAAKFQTGEEAVKELRTMAEQTARFLRACMAQVEARPIERADLEAKLMTICTCIEGLTINGNRAVEQAQALDRASRPGKVTFVRATSAGKAIQIIGGVRIPKKQS